MADETNTETQAEQQSPESDRTAVERQARDTGWVPKENWRGAPDKWVDATEYVRRGEHFLPFLQTERRRNQSEITGLRSENSTLREEIKALRENQQELAKFNGEMAKERTDRRKSELGSAIKAAREAGDDVRIAELNAELDGLIKNPPKVPEVKAPAQSQPTGGTIQPWVKSFVDEHKEFFDDPANVGLFNGLVARKRNAGDKRTGETEGLALMSETMDEAQKILNPNLRRSAPSRSEETRTGGGGGGSGKGARTFFDLPTDAQEQCDKEESRFVGQGKKFKDQTSWRKHYISEYFGPSTVVQREES